MPSGSSTFTDEGDDQPTKLFVGGGIHWDSNNAVVYVQQGFTKVAGTATYTAHERDENNAVHNYRLTRHGQPLQRRRRSSTAAPTNRPPPSRTSRARA